MNRKHAIFVAAVALLAGGCGQELLAGGQTEVSTVATDEPGTSGSPAASRSLRGAPAGPDPAAGLAVLQGTVTLTASVAILDADGRAISVTNGERTVAVPIGSAGRVLLDRDSVPVGSYTRARLTFTRVEANVTGGLGAVLGLVRVQLPQPLVKEAPISLLAQEGSPQRLVIDLNAATWLAAAGLDLLVPAATFGNAVTVRVEPGSGGV